MAKQRVEDVARLIRQCYEGSEKIFSGIGTENSNYTPVKGVKTFAEQLNHLVFVERHFVRKISAALELDMNIPDPKPYKKIEDALQSFSETRELTTLLLSQLEDKDLSHPVSFDEPGREVDVLFLLHALVEHPSFLET